ESRPNNCDGAGASLGRTQNEIRGRLRILNFLHNGSGPPLPVVEPCQISITTLIDVVHPSLHEKHPTNSAYAQEVAVGYLLSAWQCRKTSLTADVAQIQVLEICAFRKVCGVEIDTRSFAKITAIQRIASGHDSSQPNACRYNSSC